MGLTIGQKKAVTKEVVSMYRRTSKKIKGQLLDEFIQLTEYKLNYASWVLRNHGREIFTSIDDQWVKIIVGKARKKEPRKRTRKYDDKVLKALKKVWYIFDCMCGEKDSPLHSNRCCDCLRIMEKECAENFPPCIVRWEYYERC